MKIVVEHSRARLTMDFYLIVERGYQTKKHIIQPVELISKELPEEGDVSIPIEPTFRLPDDGAYEFIKEMAQIAEERGIKTEHQAKEEERTKGVLEATRYHLEDMRLLLFGKRRNKQK